MESHLPQLLREMGVVGAGGAGFPTYVKIDSKVQVVIANGTECEPLLRVDRQLMETQADRIIAGMQLVMGHTGALRGVICLKDKYHDAYDAIQKAIGDNTSITCYRMGNYYPAGDEQQIVFEVTGKVVPTGGLPLDCGALVQNVGTLIHIAEAAMGKPVTTRLLTVAGEVRKPVTLRVPIGASYADCIAAAGGPAGNTEHAIIVGGPIMGFYEADWSKPVTKTTSGIIVLKQDHYLIQSKTSGLQKDALLARAICCQCTQCTNLCPRNALGLNVEPHKVMRAIGYSDMTLLGDANSVFSCCDCGICTYYACNFGLNPARFMAQAKQLLIKEGVKPRKEIKYPPNSAIEYIKVPSGRFAQRLDVARYDAQAPLQETNLWVNQVCINLKQHIGIPAEPVVCVGERVTEGQMIAAAPEGKLSVNIHASITGVVSGITDKSIIINAERGEKNV